jgi:serine/threonine protein kinase
MARGPEEHSPRLPVGTQVGPWRVEAWQGQGTYGAIYRALRVGQEQAGPVALKLSVNPWDERMVREARLLSRLDHPGIPRLLDTGVLRFQDGTQHPWFAMQWIEGIPLYEWAEQHAPSHLQLCVLLAQLARALEALHVSGAVHRDVKGDNVLVRLSDRWPVLIDFGSGHYQGAKRLTWQSLAPGTPAYQSPQAALFELRLVRERNGYYAPSPADDLFALGVTAFRLVMGHYPPELQPHQDDEGNWRVACPDVRPLLERNPRVQPLLREWILRLLSEAPEERGSAAQLAQALEDEAQQPTEEPRHSSAPASEQHPVVPVTASGGEVPRRSRVSKQLRAFSPWVALAAAAGLALVLWSQLRLLSVSPEHAQGQVPDAGTAATGDSVPSSGEPSTSQDSSKPDPKQPKRQVSPDAKGRCPGRTQVAFKGGCWIEHAEMSADDCLAGGYEFLNGKCYSPVLELPQKAVPTSEPGEAR